MVEQRYTGTSSSDFEIVEGIFTKHSDFEEGQVITLDNERYKVIKVSKIEKLLTL